VDGEYRISSEGEMLFKSPGSIVKGVSSKTRSSSAARAKIARGFAMRYFEILEDTLVARRVESVPIRRIEPADRRRRVADAE
jgi:hypothetical protein